MKIHRQPFTVNSAPGVTLKGEITLPADLKPGEKRPAVVLVAGSGPNDRDETMPSSSTASGQVEKPFKTIAETLSEAGLIVVRYDKRGVNGPQQGDQPNLDAKLWSASTGNDFVADAQAVIGQVRQDPRVEKVAILGHSEGSMIAGAVAASGTPLAGIVMMGLVCEPFQKVIDHQVGLQEQNFWNSLPREADGTVQAKGDLAQFDADLSGDLSWNEVEGTFAKEIQHQLNTGQPDQMLGNKPIGWYRSWLTAPSTLDQMTQAAPHLSGVPILLMAGEEDVQTPLRSQALPMHKQLQALGLESQLKTYPGLGHVFSPNRDGQPTFGPLDQAFLKDLKSWAGKELMPPKVQTPVFAPRKMKFDRPALREEELSQAREQLGETETLRRALLMNHKLLARTPFLEMTGDQIDATLAWLRETPYSPELLAPTAQLAALLYRRADALPYQGYEDAQQEAPEVARERADQLSQVLGEWHRQGHFSVTQSGRPQTTEWLQENLKTTNPGTTVDGLEFLPSSSKQALKSFYQDSKTRRAQADRLEAQARKDPATGERFFREARDAYLSSGDNQIFREFGIFMEEAIKRPHLHAQFRQVAPEILNLYSEAERFGLNTPDSEVRVQEVSRVLFPVPELAGEALGAEALVPYLNSQHSQVRERAAQTLEVVWMRHPETVAPTMDWLIEQSPPTRWVDSELLASKPREVLPWELARVAADRHGWKPRPEQREWMQAVQAGQVERDPHPPAMRRVEEALAQKEAPSSQELLELHRSLEELRGDQREAPWMEHLAQKLGETFPREDDELRSSLANFPWSKLEDADAPVELRAEFAMLNSQTRNRPELRKEFIEGLGDGKLIVNVTRDSFRSMRELTGEWFEQKLEPGEKAKNRTELVQEAARLIVTLKNAHSFQFTINSDMIQRWWDGKLAEFGVDRSQLRRHAPNVKEEVAVLATVLHGDPNGTLDRLEKYNQLRDALPKLKSDQAERLFHQAQKHPQGWAEGFAQVVDTVIAREAQVEQVKTLIPELGKKKELAPKLAEQARRHPDGWEAGFQALKADLELKREQLKELTDLLPDLRRDQAEELVEKARNHPEGWEAGLQRILRSAVEGFPKDDPTPTEILLGEDFLKVGDFEVPVQD